MTLERIGPLVRAARKSRGLNQKQLADRAGVSPAMVSVVERGGNYTMKVLHQLVVDGLGMGLEVQIGGEAAPSQDPTGLVEELRHTIAELDASERYTLWILLDGWRRRRREERLTQATA